MAKLVAFYSRAGENYFGGQYRRVAVGNTENVVKQIAALTGADLFKIQQKVPYAEDYQTCIRQAKTAQQAKSRPELETLPDRLDGYDKICLWWCIPFWRPLTGRAKPSILSALTRAAV